MAKFFNSDEMGIEGVAGAVTSTVKSAAKTVAAQPGVATQDIVNQLYGVPGDAAPQAHDQQNGEVGTESMGQAQSAAKAAASVNVSRQVPQFASVAEMLGFGEHDDSQYIADEAQKKREELAARGKSPGEIDEYMRLSKMLHDEQVRDIMEPKRGEQQEESAQETREREEEEKKKKKVDEQHEEVKKKEDLAVVQKKTSAENKNWGAG